MKPRHALLLLTPFFVANAVAQTPVNTADRYAYSANTGWIDLRSDAADGVGVHATFLSRFAYGANAGWISFGSGTPSNGTSYSNTSATDFGVNLDASGFLSGYAYSANTGWINFGWATAGNPNRPRIDPVSGRLTGLAYSANTGWITLGEITAFAVTIPDPVLVSALRTALNKPTGDLTDVDLASLTSFSAPSAGLTSLVGLEKAVNLNILSIPNNSVADLTPLTGLPLQQLDATNNRIASLTPLATSPLQVLKLSHNRISNFSPLSGLNNLVELDLSYNALVDAQPVATCPHLVSVNLAHNRVKSLLGFSNLHDLQILRAEGNQIFSMDGFTEFEPVPALTVLNVSSNYLTVSAGSPSRDVLNTFTAKGVAVTLQPQFANPVITTGPLNLSGLVLPDTTVENFGDETLIAGDTLFASSVETGADGRHKPVARIFNRSATGWTFAASLSPSDDVSILDDTIHLAHDGDTLAVAGVFRDASGAPSLAAYLFRPTGSAGAWVQETRLAPAPSETVGILDDTIRDAGIVSILDDTIRPGDSPVSILDDTIHLAFDSGRLIFGGLGYDSAFGDSNHRLSPRLFTFVRTTTGAWQERAPLLPNTAFAGLANVNWHGFSLDLSRAQMGLVGILDDTIAPAGQVIVKGMVLAGILDDTIHPADAPVAAWSAQTLLPASAAGVWRKPEVRLHRPGNGPTTLAIAAILDDTIHTGIPSVFLYQNTVGSPLSYGLSHTLTPADAVDLSHNWTSLSLDFSGPLLAFGGSQQDAAGNTVNSAYLFENVASSWTQRAKVEPPASEVPGSNVTLDLDGHSLAFAAPAVSPTVGQVGGSAYVTDISSLVTTAPVVDFPDAALESLVRTALNLPSGVINRSQLGTLNSLNLNGSAVRNLSGLEFATNLQTLLLSDAFITSLVPISNLSVYTGLQVGSTWTGGHISGPHAANVIQNWLPRRPPETFTGFTTLDTLSVTSSGATVDLNISFAKKFTFNSPGGTLNAVLMGLTTSEGLLLQAGHLAVGGYTDLFGPVTASVGTTIGLVSGAVNFTGTLTNRGEFTQQGAIYARHFTNHGTLTLAPSPSAYGTYDSFYGTFDGQPGSSLTINSAVAGPDEILPPSAPGTNNNFFGSFRWSGGGTSTFSIAPRSWSYISLYKATVGDVYSLDNDNRFTFSDATWNVGLNGGFQVISNPGLPYAEAEPQVDLNNLTINNQGILRFSADDVSFKNLTVTGNPLEIVAKSVDFVKTREISQAAATPGTLRADIFEAFHKFTQPVLEGNVALRLGRKAHATTVELGNLTNSTTDFAVIGSENNTTLVTAAPGAERTLTNTGTLTIGPDFVKVDPAIANPGAINVLGATSAEFAKLSSLTGSLTIGTGSTLTIGPVVHGGETDETPRLPLTLSSGSISNQGTLNFRLHRLEFFGTTQLTGNPITLESSILNLAYPVGSSGPLPPASNFEFAAGRSVVIAEPVVPPPVGDTAVPLVPPGSLWRVLTGGYVSSSGLVNAGRIELEGPAVFGPAQPTLHATSEIINTGTIRCFNYGTVQGRLVNQGGITVTGTLTLQVDANETAPNPNRLINYGTVTVDGTLAAYSYGVQASIEQFGGTLDSNDGVVKLDQGSLFRFGGGNITGHAVELTNANLEVFSTAGNGEFVLRGPVNTLITPNGLIPPGVSLRIKADASGYATLTSPAFTNRGTITLESSSPDTSPQLSAGGSGLVNEGRIVCAALAGGNPNSILLSGLDNKGTLEIQPGAIHAVLPLNASFHQHGTLTLGASSLLSLESDGQTFEAHSGSVISGSGRIIKGFAPALLHGQIEPSGTLTITGDATFDGRLLCRLRSTPSGLAPDELVASGTLDISRARHVLDASSSATPLTGVRYILARADSLFGVPGGVYVGPGLVRRFRAEADITGNTLGITLHALTPATQNYGHWAGAYGTAGILPDPDSDLDHDGTPALIEYAFGLRGDTSDSARTEWSQPTPGGNLQLTFPWDNYVRDVTWRLDFAPTAAGPWTPVSAVSPVISAPDANGLRSVSYSLPATGSASFFRLTVLPGTPPL